MTGDEHVENSTVLVYVAFVVVGDYCSAGVLTELYDHSAGIAEVLQSGQQIVLHRQPVVPVDTVLSANPDRAVGTFENRICPRTRQSLVGIYVRRKECAARERHWQLAPCPSWNDDKQQKEQPCQAYSFDSSFISVHRTLA